MGRFHAFTSQERAIAKSLGVTPAGLTWLMQLSAGKSHRRGNEAASLRVAGYVEPTAGNGIGFLLTDSGRALVARARAMGW